MKEFSTSKPVGRFGGVWRELLKNEGVVTRESVAGADRDPASPRRDPQPYWFSAGRLHVVSDEVAAELAAAGYGRGIREAPETVGNRVRAATVIPRPATVDETAELRAQLASERAAREELEARIARLEGGVKLIAVEQPTPTSIVGGV